MDLSSEICKKYVLKSDKISYIESVNEGVSSARNKGILASKGTYIMFVDGDDSIPQNTLEVMYNEISTNKVDIVIGDFLVIDDKKQEKWKINSCKENSYLDFIAINGVWGPCFKLVKKSLITTYFNTCIYIGEDALFWAENASNCSYKYIDKVVYNYYMNDESIMHKLDVDNRNITLFNALQIIIENKVESNSVASLYFMIHYIENVFRFNYKMKDTNHLLKKNNKIYVTNMNKYFNIIIKSKKINFIKLLKLFIKVILVNFFKK